MEDKIDFIITWVDGNDPEWLKEKRKFSNETSDDRVNRYRDWETLKYIFRGIEKYAPWVNKIFLVTCGQWPEWLNQSNDKLVCVNHTDFIPENYLPTFNSNAIELNFHRIKNLSENFVIFNDDMFLINKVEPNDFFQNGLPCDSAVLSPIISYDKDGFSKVIQSNMGIINTYFDKTESIKMNKKKWFNLKYRNQLFRTLCLLPWKHFPGFFDTHLPTSTKKSTMLKIWNLEYDLLNNTCLSHIRDNNTNVNQWLFRYWQIASGEFIPRSINFGKKYQYGLDPNMYNDIINQKYKIVCLNDIEGNYDFYTEKKRTLNALNQILPNKSSFEK